MQYLKENTIFMLFLWFTLFICLTSYVSEMTPLLKQYSATLSMAFFVLYVLLPFGLIKGQSCTYTLTMHDTYGDGWNGGYLKIYVNDTFIGNFSGVNSASSDTFQMNDGDSLKLTYYSGSWEEENSYQLYDAAWNLVTNGGPNIPAGVVYEGIGNCVSLVVPGNNPCTAIQIDTGQCVIGDNTAYLTSGLIAPCANFQSHDIWYQLLIPPSGNLSITTDSGSINDTGIAVWTDSTCTSIHCIACDDDAGPGYFSQVLIYDGVPGQKLYIQVFGYNGATGTFRLCIKDMGTVLLDSTELPIVMINTLGQEIPDANKIDALMDIKYNGLGNITHVTDPSTVYSGHIGIEIRGQTSAWYPQHPYGIETRTASGANNNVSLLGMPAENDWVLLSNFNDRSLIRNTLAHKLFTEMGNYSPRTLLCEVLIDSSYKGIYVFGEKIKRDNNRVDIAKLNPGDTLGDQISGGYILQQSLWNASNSFESNYSPIDHPGFDVHFLYEYPSFDVINPPQKAYIADYVDSLETALYSQDFANPISGYRKYLDVKSFIDYFLVNEVSRNADGFKKSVFFNKDRYSNGGKLKAGPVWDFDWAWKNIWGCSICEHSDGSGWAHHVNDCFTDNYSCGYYIRLLQDTTFANELRCTYETYRQSILDTAYLYHYIDSVGVLVQNAQLRHFKKWPILGVSGPAPETGNIAITYVAELDTLKAWIATRLNWLDANIPGHCLPVNVDNSLTKQENVLHFYPNPSTGLIHFEGRILSAEMLQLSFYSITGELVDKLTIQGGDINIKYQFNKKGVYFYSVAGAKGEVQRGKIIVL